MDFLPTFQELMCVYYTDIAQEDCDIFTPIKEAYENFTTLTPDEIKKCIEENTEEDIDAKCIPAICRYLEDHAKLKTKKSLKPKDTARKTTSEASASAPAPTIDAPLTLSMPPQATIPTTAPLVLSATPEATTPIDASISISATPEATTPIDAPLSVASPPAKIRTGNIFMRIVPMTLKAVKGDATIEGFSDLIDGEVTPVNGLKATGKAFALCQELNLFEKLVGSPRMFRTLVQDVSATLPAQTPLTTLSAIIEGFVEPRARDLIIQDFLQLKDLPAVKPKKRKSTDADEGANGAKKVKVRKSKSKAPVHEGGATMKDMITVFQQINQLLRPFMGAAETN